MTNEEKILVLQNMKMSYGTCRTEKEVLEDAINALENEQKLLSDYVKKLLDHPEPVTKAHILDVYEYFLGERIVK